MAKRTLSMPFSFSLEKELKENPHLKEVDLQILRDWCSKQAHLPNIPDQYLVIFLHSNYYRVESTKNAIEQYFTIRSHVPEFFENRDPIGSKDVRKALQVSMSMALPKKSPEGYTVWYGELLDTDPSHYSFNDAVKLFFMLGDLKIAQTVTSEGFIFIANCKGISFGHLGRISLMSLKKIICYVQEALPIRIKGIHYINAPAVVETLLNMSKPFLNKELLDLIHLHTTPDTLAPFVPLDIIPGDYGTAKESFAELMEPAIKELEDHREWFIEEESVFRVNESLRVGQCKSADNLFGVEGSFKKLDID